MLYIGSYRLTLATVFTLLRIMLVPFLIYALYQREWLYAGMLLGIAAFSDFLDGFFARLLQQETELGALLDPCADKLIMISCYTVLLDGGIPALGGIYLKYFMFCALFRECIIALGALVVCYLQRSCAVRPTIFGKISMAVQFAFLSVCLYMFAFHQAPGYFFMGIAACVSLCLLCSFGQYVINFRGV